MFDIREFYRDAGLLFLQLGENFLVVLHILFCQCEQLFFRQQVQIRLYGIKCLVISGFVDTMNRRTGSGLCLLLGIPGVKTVIYVLGDGEGVFCGAAYGSICRFPDEVLVGRHQVNAGVVTGFRNFLVLQRLLMDMDLFENVWIRLD